jgi:uncharacterized protein YkwD
LLGFRWLRTFYQPRNVVQLSNNGTIAPADGTIAKDAFTFQNTARQNPALIVQKLQAKLSATTDKTSSYAVSVQDAINYLSTMSALSPLIWNKALYKACLDHAKDQCGKGTFSHTGNDGSSFTDRIKRYGTWSGTSGENLVAGYTTGEDMIMALIIDDGVPSRGHRLNIYSSSFKYVGIGTLGTHPTYKNFMALDYAGGMTTTDTTACEASQFKSFATAPTLTVLGLASLILLVLL